MPDSCVGFSLCSSIGSLPSFIKPKHVVEFMLNNARALADGNLSNEQLAIIAQDMEYIAKNMIDHSLARKI